MIRLALLLVAAAALAQDDPLATLRREHPRLIALDSDIQRIRGLIQTDERARRIHERLVAEAAKIESAPTVEYRIVGPRLLAQSRRCLDRIYTLALLYRLDGKRQYLDRALRELRAAADFPDWNPSHFLDTAEMTHAFAIGYDWLYPALTAEQRGWIRRAIIEKGLDQALPIYRARRGWAVNRFNWNQVCNGGITIGALAVAEEQPDKAREVLHAALESIRIAMASYGPDGGWGEGPGYWHYATRYNVYFLAALETALGSDFGLPKIQGFAHAGHFRVYFSGPSGKTFNYADAGDTVGTAAEMYWLARKFNQPVYAWQQHAQIDRVERGEALDLVWYQREEKSPQQAGWPLDALFRGVDVAFFRSSWDDPNAIFAAIKAGENRGGQGHTQLDLGTFVLDAGGTRWATDLGPDDYNLPQYFGKLRWTYYRMRTESHNTVLIDNENQDPMGTAAIVAHRFEPRFSRVRIDLTKAYPGKVTRLERGFAVVDRKHVIVQDELRAPAPVEALWSMVTEAEVSVDGASAELRKPGWRVTARVLSPAGAKFDVASTRPPAPQNQNEGTRKLVVRLPAKVSDARIVVALTPHPAGQPAPRLTWEPRPLEQW